MRVLAVMLGLAGLAVVAVEAAMQPSVGERLGFAVLFGSVAVMGAAAAWWLRRRSGRMRSLVTMVVAVPLVALAAVALTVGLSAGFMFTSGHDLEVVVVALGLGVAVGAAMAVGSARTLSRDLAAIASTADLLGSGDLDSRTGVRRSDEIGDAAAALDAMADRLAEAERLRAADHETRRRLLASIGHDLRTPLSALQAAIEALQDGVAADPGRYLSSMARDVTALRTLVDDLFLLARIESGDYRAERTAIDLAELADDAAEALSPVASTKGVTVAVATCHGAVVSGAPGDLSRAIRNLIDNAIRHAPADSRVLVEVTNGGPAATLRVVDQGAGFAPEVADRAFDRFVKADAARGRDSGGAGLGLAIAKGLIEAHGGDIWIESGDGGRVAMRLPVGA